MIVTIKRVTAMPEGIFGVLLVDNLPLALTLEPTLDDTLAPVIPIGVYFAVPTWYNKGNYKTFEITGVAGHSRLLFHVGNTEADSLGCVLLGTSFGSVGGKRALLRSSEAFALFMNAMPSTRFPVRFI